MMCLKDTVGSCTYELTAAVTASPRFAQTKSEEGGGHEILPLAEELATNS